VFYRGTSGEWSNITVSSSNDEITDHLYFYSEAELEGNYWHYVIDVPTPW